MTAGVFDGLLGGMSSVLVRDDGSELGMAADRWRRAAGTGDRWLLDRCTGPTVDLGCGPGRLVAALLGRGIPALGVDVSPLARRLCVRRGAPMLLADLFGPLPGEGRWRHVILADGNIGIGGDPATLLVRAAALLDHGGTVLVETDPDPGARWRGTIRPGRADGPGVSGVDAVPWACVGLDTLAALAPAVPLEVVATAPASPGGRAFAELRPRPSGARPAG